MVIGVIPFCLAALAAMSAAAVFAAADRETAVRDVCRWWAEDVQWLNGAEKSGKKAPELKAAKALLDIIATPVSPELLPAKEGEIEQKTGVKRDWMNANRDRLR